jgi:hypothetical protein
MKMEQKILNEKLLIGKYNLPGIDLNSLTIQTFDDAKLNRPLARIFKYNATSIYDFQSKGAGIYWTINPQENSNRGIKYTNSLSRLALDLDVAHENDGKTNIEIKQAKAELNCKLDELEIPPSAIIETKNGLQPYWIFSKPLLLNGIESRREANEKYKKLCDGLETIIENKNDRKDISGVVRLPGSLHQKNPKDTFEIRVTGDGHNVDFEKFEELYIAREKNKAAQSVDLPDMSDDSIYKQPVKTMLSLISGHEMVKNEQFGFTEEKNGKCNIIINGKISGQFINLENNTIGAGKGEASVNIVDWVVWYGIYGKIKAREELDKLLGKWTTTDDKKFKEKRIEQLKVETHDPKARTNKDKKLEKTTKKQKDNIINTSYYETKDYILEQIRNPISDKDTAYLANPANSSTKEYVLFKFIKYSKLNGELSFVEEDTDGSKTIKPIINDLANRGIVNLPSLTACPNSDEFAQYAEFAPLVSDISTFFDKFFDVPEFERKFLPFYVLFTWVYQKFDFVPYLQFCGLTGTGKTRTGETVAGLCYKSIDVRGSASISAIFRMADGWKGTLFIDEFDMDAFGKDNYGAALAFLKSGVGDGSVVRVEGANKREVVAYSVKSPKVFTSERPINDAGLQSRTYVIEMESSKKKLPLFKIKEKYDTELNNLRVRLLCWRLKNYGKINLSEIEYGYPELQCFDKRVQQVITPIYFLADEESRKSVLQFAKEQEEATFIERREATAGVVFDVIKSLNNDEPEFANVREEVNKRLESDGQKPITVKALGKILKISLHFDTEKIGHEHITKVTWNKDKFDSMQEYYGYERGLVSNDVKTSDISRKIETSSYTENLPQSAEEIDEYISDLQKGLI